MDERYNPVVEVLDGEKYREHRYRRVDESCMGKWQFYGQSFDVNPSNERFLCAKCVTEYNKMKSGETNPSLMVNSYQVVGDTNSKDKWTWERFSCSNENCWGDEARFFEVQRQDVWNKPGIKQYVFLTTKMDSRGRIQTSKLYAKMRKRHHNFYEGFGWVGSKPTFFFPELLKDEPSDCSSYYFYVCSDQRRDVPASLKDKPFEDWPYQYRNREHRYPMMLDFTFFEEIKGLPSPISFPSLYCDLYEKHILVGSTCIDIYPGGGGCSVYQYRRAWVEDESTVYKHPDKEIARFLYNEDGIQCYWPLDRQRSPGGKVYVPSVRDGMCGPFISHYVRLNNHFRYVP